MWVLNCKLDEKSPKHIFLSCTGPKTIEMNGICLPSVFVLLVIGQNGALYDLSRQALTQFVLNNSSKYWYKYVEAFSKSKISKKFHLGLGEKTQEKSLITSAMRYLQQIISTFHYFVKQPKLICHKPTKYWAASTEYGNETLFCHLKAVWSVGIGKR